MRATLAFCVSLGFLLASGVGSAGERGQRIVVASVKVGDVTHTAKLKVDASGRIRPWSAGKWASITPGKGKSIFYWLGENRETSGIEWERAGKAPNGYGLVSVGTTADSVTLGISLKDGKGFFKYQDLGSGNGNSQYTLKVEEKAR